MRRWTLLLVASLAWPAVHAREPAPLAQVLDAKRQFFEAIDRNDVEATAAMLAPGFIEVDPNRGVRDRGEFLADLQAARRGRDDALLRREWTQVRTWPSGDQGAVVVGRSTWRPAASAGPSSGDPPQPIWSRMITQQWRWEQARWLLLSQHVTLLPAPPEIVSFPSGKLTLQAMLFRPDGKGPFPAIVYAHGNEPDPSDLFETVGPALAARGYLVLAPHRRGAGLSADQSENLLRQLTRIERDQGLQARTEFALQQLQGPQLADMIAAIDAVRRRADVDPRRIYMIGNSFGGILAMLAAERGLGLAGVANFAGAAINWDRSDAFQKLMTRAALNAQVPLFVAQAANDYSIEPTRVLGRALCEAGKTYRAKVFPAFGVTAGEGHSLGVDGVRRWGDEVLSFLAKPTPHPDCR
ncbi:MAG TPA: alpha/beta fold hydrolase [Methylibium sp.]|nr:alpha/beta fold hydrolase [Methylibium sp.]